MILMAYLHCRILTRIQIQTRTLNPMATLHHADQCERTIITIREGYVFKTVSVCPLGVCLSAWWDTPSLGADPPDQAPPWKQTFISRPPTPQDGYCCRRYASYWNAFLFSYACNIKTEAL